MGAAFLAGPVLALAAFAAAAAEIHAVNVDWQPMGRLMKSLAA